MLRALLNATWRLVPEIERAPQAVAIGATPTTPSWRGSCGLLDRGHHGNLPSCDISVLAARFLRDREPQMAKTPRIFARRSTRQPGQQLAHPPLAGKCSMRF